MRPALLLALALAAAVPARSQPTTVTPTDVNAADLASLTPETVLGYTWSVALQEATAASWALDQLADSVGTAEVGLLGDPRTFFVGAASGSAAASRELVTAFMFSLALADSTERPDVYAALAGDLSALGDLLGQTEREMTGAALAPAALAPAADDDGAGDVRAGWRPRATEIRELVGRLEGATAALGIVVVEP